MATFPVLFAHVELGSGFRLGGYAVDRLSGTEFLRFTTNTQGAGNALPEAVYQQTGLNSLTHGYGAAGSTAASAYSASICYMPFSTEIYAPLGSALSIGRRYNPAGVSSRTHGYVCGGRGYNGSTYTALSVVDKLNFTDHTTSVSSSLSTAVEGVQGFGNISAGYIHGGATFTSSTMKMPYVTGIWAAGSAMPAVCRYMTEVNSGYAGYLMGGELSDNTTPARCVKMPFPTETYGTVSVAYVSGRYGTGLSSQTKGYSATLTTDASSVTLTTGFSILFSTDTYVAYSAYVTNAGNAAGFQRGAA